eukprot:s1143_g8.t1
MPTILVVTARIIILDDDKILRPKVEVLPPPLPSLSSPPAQLVAPPTPATLNSNHEAEQDIARMRMKARTYTSTEGICGPLAEGSVTLFGTPKNTATDSEEASKLFKGHAFFDRPACAGGTERSYILTALSQAALEVSSIAEEKSDDSKQNPGSPKTLGVVPREAHGPGEEKPEKRRGSNRASKSISMREPRSIFLHQVTNRAGEEDEEDEDMDDPAEAIPCKKESLCTCIQKMCLWLVCLEYFDYIMGLAILANAVLMGVQADIAVQNARTGAKEPPVIRAVAVVLGAVFTAELVIRILAYRLDFFMKPGWRWNAFDFLLVFLQLSEEVVTVLACLACSGFAADPRTQESGESSGSLRPPRVPRAFECRTLVQSIASTMTSLLWTVVLLLLLIFVVGICFTQVVADVGLEAPQLIQEGTDTFEYYGSLLRSVMSLYQSITSGVSWRDASQPLERHQPIMGLIFAVYIAFAALAMLNVITGVFVESAMASARDRASADIALLEENNVTVVSRMRELVSKMEIGESGRMTWEQFEGQLNNPIMEAYFKSLDLSVTEAESLFRLLDIDNEGSIDVEEFIAGCCRIHGPAKAIDLTTLMCQVMLLHRQPALSDSSTVAVDSAAVEDFLHFTGFLAGGETPATMSSASPLAKMQGTPRSARRFSFCLPAEEKALSNDNLTLELPELNEMEASGDLVDSSPRTHGSNRRSANSSDKNLNGNLPAGKPLYLDLLDKTQAFYLVFFKITYIVTSIIVLAVFYKLDATYERQKDTCSLAAILVPCSVSALLLAETYQPFDILWTFSQFCEGFAMVPQYVFCYRDSSRLSKDVGVTLYVLSMGAYRCFYAANWIYKKARCHASPATTLEVSPRASAGVRPGPAKRSPAPSAAICAQLATANGALSDYVKVRTVGRGSFGEALLVRHRSSGQMSVLKRVRLEGSSDAAAAAESAAREAQVLQKLRHPHIVEFLGAFVDNSRDSTGGTLCLLMAFCEGGDLQHRLQKVRQECRRLSEQPALRWFDELCSALAYVHQHQVLHRDLKPSNIFLSGRSAGSEVLPPTETKLSELREIDLYEPEAWWQGRTQDEEQQDAEVAQMLARQGSFGLPAQQRVVTMQCGVCQSSVQVQVPLSAAPDSVIRVPCPRCTAENEIPGSSMRAGPPPGMVGPSMFDPSMMGDALDDELIHVGCEMGNTMVEMMIDTGAQTSVISEPLVRRLQLQGHMDSRFQGMAAGVGTARILGKLRGVPVKMGHVEFALALRIQL